MIEELCSQNSPVRKAPGVDWHCASASAEGETQGVWTNPLFLVVHIYVAGKELRQTQHSSPVSGAWTPHTVVASKLPFKRLYKPITSHFTEERLEFHLTVCSL